MISSIVLAHGIGGRRDLPLDLSFFLVGAAIVVVLSFVGLAVLWPKPRLQDGVRSRVIDAPWLRPLAGVLRVLGVFFFGLVLVAGLVGRNDGSENIVPVLIYVAFWLVVPFAAAFVGNLWTAINPFRTMIRWFRFGEE